MWYWCAHALEHLGRVIIVGGDAKAVRRLGFSPASSLNDALEMATDVVGPSPTLTHLHDAADHDGGRALMAARAAPVLGALLGRARSRPLPVRRARRGRRRCERPDPERKLGLEYDHEWSRRYPVRLARAMVMDNIARPAARLRRPGHASAASSTSATSRARSSSRPTTPATSTRRCC